MLPELLARALTKPHFWVRIANPNTRVPGGYEELVPHPVELVRAGDHVLHLRFLPPRGIEVALAVASGRAVTELVSIRADTLAFDDTENPGSMRHALRWAELDELSRWAAITTELPHPGLLIALCSRAAPVCDADGDYPLHVVKRAFATTRAQPDDIQHVLADTDRRGAGISWTRDDKRWIAAQPPRTAAGTRAPLRSTRTDRGAFPHEVLAELFAALRAIARPWRTPAIRALAQRCANGERESFVVLSDALQDTGCDRPAILDALAPKGKADAFHIGWVLELLLDAEPGTLLRTVVGPWPDASPVYWQNIYLTLPDGARDDYERLRTVLARSGMRLYREAESPFIHIGVQGSDFEQVVRSVETALRSARAPRGSAIYCDLPPTRTIPL